MATRFQASIIIPLLSQHLPWLEKCVRSAIGQTAPVETIVVTSPLTPDSNLEILRCIQQEGAALSILVQQRPGFAAAINDGFRAATTNRLGLLLSDDWLLPNAVERCLPHFSDIVSTHSAGYAADGVTRLISIDHRCTQSEFEGLQTLERKAAHLSHFFLFHKNKAQEVGWIDETLGDAPGIDDFDFVWVLLEHRATVSILPEQLYCYRDHFGERLTLTEAAIQTANLERILAKHGIAGEEQKRILQSHAHWFGRPIHVVQAEFDQEPSL